MHLPHDVVRGAGRRFGTAMRPILRRHRQLAERNIARAMPELGEDERRRIVRRCYRHFGSAFFEVFTVSRFSNAELDRRFLMEGWHHVESALAAGRGLMLIGGHFGSWQVATFPVARRLGRLHVIARPPDNPFIARDLNRVREQFGVEVLPRSGVGHRLVNLLRRGGTVGIVIDQRVPPKTGIVVPFLGHPARTSEVPAFIATRFGTPAVPVSCRPTEDGRYTIRFGPAIEAGGTGPEAVARLTVRYLDEIERDIREMPELWFWMHDRWRL